VIPLVALALVALPQLVVLVLLLELDWVLLLPAGRVVLM